MASPKKQSLEPIIVAVVTVIVVALIETIVTFDDQDDWSKLMRVGLAVGGTLLVYSVARIVRYVRTRSARESADQIDT